MSLPEHIDDKEKLVRILFSPKNISKDEKKIRASAFRTPGEIDEVSVNRVDYCSPDFCKQQGKKMDAPKNDRSYFGFAVIHTKEVRSVQADAVYSKKDDNVYHADIKIGFIPTKGQELPAEYQFKVDEMARKARLYKDPDVTSDNWLGDPLK